MTSVLTNPTIVFSAVKYELLGWPHRYVKRTQGEVRESWENYERLRNRHKYYRSGCLAHLSGHLPLSLLLGCFTYFLQLVENRWWCKGLLSLEMQVNYVWWDVISCCPWGLTRLVRIHKFMSLLLIAYVCEMFEFFLCTRWDIILVHSLINESNKNSDMYSFYICIDSWFYLN